MSGVTARVCGGAPAQTAAGPLPVVTLGAQPAAAASPPPPSAAPARLAVATSPRPVAAAPAPPAFRAKLGGLGVAQVAASPTAQGAQHVLDRLRPLIVPPLTSSIDSATVNNAAVFRASVTGFVSLGDAQAFCARAASVSKTCWVHRKAADTAPPPTHHP
ncbi:MAG: SPOR domain-containing protein [Caulobacteraceae bacterium]